MPGLWARTLASVLTGALMTGVLVCSPAPALAQATTQDRSRNAVEALSDIDRQYREWQAVRGIQATPAETAVAAVTDALARRDCAAAVAALNAGLAKSYPEIFTLAGALYEEGACVKQNWERAVSLYQRAASVDHPGAAARLSAGYAAPVGGRDRAATLWWALRAKVALPAPCSQVAALLDDADRFVAALRAWPAGQLDACAYTSAVLASVQSEAETSAPGLAVAYGLTGSVRLSFVPSAGQVDIVDQLREGALPAGVRGDSIALAAGRRQVRLDFVATLRQRADMALKRYDKPATLPADWRVEAVYEFRAGR